MLKWRASSIEQGSHKLLRIWVQFFALYHMVGLYMAHIAFGSVQGERIDREMEPVVDQYSTV